MMAYFPNGTAHEAWVVDNCNKCANYNHVDPSDSNFDPEKNCPIDLAHLLYNHEECNNDKSILHILIPQTENGLGNKQCRMFRPKNDGFICGNCKKDYYGPPMSGDEDYWETQIQKVQGMNR